MRVSGAIWTKSARAVRNDARNSHLLPDLGGHCEICPVRLLETRNYFRSFPRYARNSHLFPKFSFAMLETHIYFYREAKSGKHILSRKQNTPALPQRHELALGSNLSTQAEPRSNYSVASSASTTATASSAASARSAASATSAASSASSSSR